MKVRVIMMVDRIVNGSVSRNYDDYWVVLVGTWPVVALGGTRVVYVGRHG